MSGRQVEDRRILKTKELLREALGALICEKPYDAITVREILDRANVGRSTFYMHFRDKDELLSNCIHDMLGALPSTGLPSSAKPYERIILFSLSVFEHVHQHRRVAPAKIGTRAWAVIHKHLHRVLAKSITDELRKKLHGRRKTTTQISLDLLVQYVASTFILVLNWWVESRNPLPPKEVNDLFRELVVPTLAAACE